MRTNFFPRSEISPPDTAHRFSDANGRPLTKPEFNGAMFHIGDGSRRQINGDTVKVAPILLENHCGSCCPCRQSIDV